MYKSTDSIINICHILSDDCHILFDRILSRDVDLHCKIAYPNVKG